MLDIKQLLSLPESKTLEFKQDASSLPPIIKTIVAFANTAGGVIIIGKKDDGSLCGVEKVFDEEERIATAIAENIRPTLLPEIEVITVDGKSLIVIRVSHWKGPFYVKKKGIPRGVYIRLGSTSRLAGEELIHEMQRAISLSFDQSPLDSLTLSNLDKESIEQSFKQRGLEVTKQKLISMGILSQYQGKTVPTKGGLILFGKEPEKQHHCPDARVRCARFKGLDKTHIIDQIEIERGLIDAIREVPMFIERNTRLTSSITSMRRLDIREYSPLAIREVLVNALAHADYSLTGAHTQISIFDNRLEIQNPGMFPFGFTLEDFKAGISKIRNRVITRVLRELGFMEEWGSGYKRIQSVCKEGGYPLPTWEEFGTMVKVTFYPHAMTQVKRKQKLSTKQEAILNFLLKNEPLSFKEIYATFSDVGSERTLRYILAELKELDLIQSIGAGRGTKWQATTY